jgi:uncharacterized membrane protein
MQTTNKKIEQLKTNGYELQFENVFNKAFENYKKIAVYAGLAILVFGFLLVIVAGIGIVGFIGVENINPNSMKQLEAKMLQPEYIGNQFIVALIFSSLFSPISAGFLKMAEAGAKDTEFKMRHFFSFYNWSFFKELIIATFIITLVSTGINSLLTYYKIPFIGNLLSFVIGIYTTLAIPLIIFGKQKALEAIQASISISNKQFFTIFLLMLVAFFGSLVGLIGFCIGVLFTIPFNISMQYAIYDAIIGIENEEAVLIETEEN